jgi:RHS repeat-associated protein
MEDMSEFGVPSAGSPGKYKWLGAGEFPTELPSGVIAMGARSYVPGVGRFLQPDPNPGGSANAYAYTYGNPLNESDPSGEWSLNETSGGASAVGSGPGVQLQGGTGIAEGAIVPPPVNRQAEEAFWADPPWDQVTAGDEEYEEYEEYEGEQGESEWANYRHGANPNSEESHVEPISLYQQLGEEVSKGSYAPAGGLFFIAAGHGTPAPKHGHHGSANEGGCTPGYARGKRCRPSSNEGLEVATNLCIFNWWNPYGWACGAYYAGKKIYVEARK